MTGTTRSSAEIDPRRKRILFRCWHRGIREMDLVLGSFRRPEIATLRRAELDELERIMAEDRQRPRQMGDGREARARTLSRRPLPADRRLPP
jgi:succinate dehydrogenase flavin-adding protein (antitoxin of CptAB toxin-antitoxin module)